MKTKLQKKVLILLVSFFISFILTTPLMAEPTVEYRDGNPVYIYDQADQTKIESSLTELLQYREKWPKIVLANDIFQKQHRTDSAEIQKLKAQRDSLLSLSIIVVSVFIVDKVFNK